MTHNTETGDNLADKLVVFFLGQNNSKVMNCRVWLTVVVKIPKCKGIVKSVQ